MDKFISDMPKLFGIANDILIAGFDQLGRDHGMTLEKVLRIYWQASLKLKKCLIRCTSIPFFGEVISQLGVGWDVRKVQTLIDMPPPKSKIELQLFLGYTEQSKFSLVTAEVCEPL